MLNISVPESARFALSAALHDRICSFLKLRNAPDIRTRRFARQSVRHFISVSRQLV